MIKYISLILAFIMQVTGLAQLHCQTGEAVLPVDGKNGGDPVIVEDNGHTYYTYTTGGGVDIKEIKAYDDTAVIREKTIYYMGNDGIVGDIWAPEIHKIGDRWYIVSCALFDANQVPEGVMPEAKEKKEHGDYYRYGFVLESKTEDIFGEYEFKNRLAPDGLNNIDGTYLQKDGKLYYVCSAYADVAHQQIFITEMENPYTLKVDENGKNNAVRLSKPTYLWEKNGWWVNEGPAVLYKNNSIYIVYSASGFSSGKYCMGMLTLTGDDPLNKCSWIKSPVKVFSEDKSKGIYHPGHCSFLYRDSGEIIMVYHATNNKDFSASPRCTYVKELQFIENYPLFNY